MFSFRKFVGSASVAALMGAVAFAAPASADYPERSIKLVVPFGAGGGTDTMARTFAPQLEKALGATVIVVNRPGAGGQVGMAEVAQSEPDGYTIGITSNTDMMLNQILVEDAGYTMDSFDYIGSINISANALVVGAHLPFTTYQEFAEYAKDNPGKITLGSSGATHIYEIISQEVSTGIKVNYMRFSGGGESRNALLGSHVDGVMIDKRFVPSLVDSGLKPLAVASPERFEFLPDLPTFKEVGVDLVNASRRVVILPKGVPEERIEVLEEAMASFLGSEEFAEKLEEINEVQDYLPRNKSKEDVLNQEKQVRLVVESNIEKFNN